MPWPYFPEGSLWWPVAENRRILLSSRLLLLLPESFAPCSQFGSFLLFYVSENDRCSQQMILEE